MADPVAGIGSVFAGWWLFPGRVPALGQPMVAGNGIGTVCSAGAATKITITCPAACNYSSGYTGCYASKQHFILFYFFGSILVWGAAYSWQDFFLSCAFANSGLSYL